MDLANTPLWSAARRAGVSKTRSAAAATDPAQMLDHVPTPLLIQALWSRRTALESRKPSGRERPLARPLSQAYLDDTPDWRSALLGQLPSDEGWGVPTTSLSGRCYMTVPMALCSGISAELEVPNSSISAQLEDSIQTRRKLSTEQPPSSPPSP